MKISAEYLAEQDDCVRRNFAGYKKNLKDKQTLLRLNTIKSFVSDGKSILSVGSGGIDPIFVGASHACDISPVSGELLSSQTWPGLFQTCSCDNLPYTDKQFEFAYCTEVIEHLPTLEAVRMTFNELNRVSHHWIVTTPSIDVHEPTHKFLFKLAELGFLTSDIHGPRPVCIEQRGIFWYVHNGERKIFD